MRVPLECLCIALCLSALPLRAQTRLIFPRVVFQRNYFSGLAVANPTPAPATITLAAYKSDGTLLAESGITNPARKTIASGEQYVALANEIFTPPASIGDGTDATRVWVEVTSPADGLTGFFLDGDGRLTFMDGSDAGAAGIELVLPIVENTAPVSTEIAVVNPGDAATDVWIELLRADGTGLPPVHRRTIAARGALLGPLSTLFAAAGGEAAALRITGNTPVVCFGYLLRTSDNSLVTVPARSTALAAKTLYFPQLAEGDPWVTTVGIVNTTRDSETVTLTAYAVDGSLIAAPGITNPAARIVPGRGVLRESARRLFGFPSSPLRQGWIKVEAVRPALYGYVEYGAGTNRALVSAQLEACSRAVFSYVALQGNYFTGLAVLNPSSVTTNVEIVYLARKGNPIAKLQTVLRPGERQSKVLGVPNEWFPNLPAGTVDGALFIKSDNPIIATQLFGTTDFALLSNVPPQKVTTSFDPASRMPTVRVTPALAVVETGKSQKFISSGVPDLGWYVDEVRGGNSTVGTVAADGTYRAPAKAPAKRSIAINARNPAGDQSGGASINVVEREEIVRGLKTVTAVAYFENCERFFIAEQEIIGAPGKPERREADTNSRILEQKRDGTRIQYGDPFAGDALGKMLPYVDAGGQNWLLVAGTTSGRIYRINLDTRDRRVIAEGLNKPNSMVLNGAGDLLVAVESAIEVIPRARFDAALSGGRLPPAHAVAAQLPRRAVDVVSPRGVAADRCSGAVYVTTAGGALWEYMGTNRRDVLNGSRLTDPNEIFVLYLDGESKCREAVVLLICEKNGVALVVPSLSFGLEFVGNEEFPRDLEFFPGKSPFAPRGEPALVIAETDSISAVGVEGLYSEDDPISDEEAEFAAAEFPHVDPEGDTLEYESASAGYEVPDIIAVDAVELPDSVLIATQFSRPVIPTAEGVKKGVDILIELDTDADFFTGDWSVFNRWTLFGETFLGVDWWIKSYTGRIYEFTSKREYPIDVTWLNDVVVMEIPKSIVDLSIARLVMGVGNWIEGTDIAPNALYIDLGLLQPFLGGIPPRRLAIDVKSAGPGTLPAPPRRPRKR